MNILITGGLGFIGSNMVNHLLAKSGDASETRETGIPANDAVEIDPKDAPPTRTGKGPKYNIVVLDKIDTCSNRKNIDLTKVTFVQGNICDANLVNFLLVQYQIEIVMHFAAETHVDKSFGNSLKFTKSNILGTHTLLECARNYGKLKRFIHVSTDEVYGETSHHTNKVSLEGDKPEPTNPYAATKAAAELIVRSYHLSFGIPVIITRSNNIFGPAQYPDKLIPRFITLLGSDKKCEIHGTGENIRSYLHVHDVCRAFEIIMEKGEIGKTYNIGSDIEHCNLEVWRVLMRVFRADYPELLSSPRDEDYLKFVGDRVFNDRRYWIDSSEIKALGWRQERSDFYETLRSVAKWYLERPNYWESTESALKGYHCK